MERFQIVSALAFALVAGSDRPVAAQCYGPLPPPPMVWYQPAPLFYQSTWTWLTPATPTRISTETPRQSTPPAEVTEPEEGPKPQPMPKKAGRASPPPPIKDPDNPELPAPQPLKKSGEEPERPRKQAGAPGPSKEGATTVPFDVFQVAADGGPAATDSAFGIGFYNHSDRDVTIEVADRVITLKHGGRRFRIRLPRDFVWRQKDGAEQKGHVPVGSAGLEIVFRK